FPAVDLGPGDDNDDPGRLVVRTIWNDHRSEVAECVSNTVDPHAATLRNWLDELVQGETPTGMLDRLPEARRRLFASSNGHFVLLPLTVGDDSLGALVLERAANAAHWDDLEIGFLRIAAADLARALDRANRQRVVEESEERHRAILDEMTDVIWVVDEQVRIRHITPSCSRVLGYAPDDLVGKIGLDFVHPDDHPVVKTAFQEVVHRANPNTPTEFRFRHARGHWVDLEATGVNLIARPGIDGILLTTRDVTRRKASEQSARLAHFALEAVSDAAYMYRPVGNFLYVNEAACRALGYSREELLQRGVGDIDPDFPAERHQKIYAKLKQHGGLRFESSHQRKDGTRFPVEISLNMNELEGQKLICAFARDITDRKKAELELQRSEERFRSLIENVSDVVATIREDGTIEYVSPSVERVVGFGSEESIGTNVLDYVHPDDRPAARAGLQLVFNSPKDPNKLECRIRRRDGTFRHVEVIGSQFVNPRGEVRGVIMYRDVTDRIVAESERRELEAQRRQSQKLEAVGQLAGGVAHDFNNLLTAIRGYAELAHSDLPAGHPVSAYLNESIQACARAESLVRQLLLFSRRGEPQLQSIHLDEVVSSMGKMLKRLIGEHIELRIAPPRESLTISADPGQMEQILINLCVNARDALTVGGHINVATYGADLDETFCRENSWARPGDYAVLEVSDTGAGIPAEYMDRIFDPFFTTKGIGQGTGLGLATVYGITTNHNGLIHVESQLGTGTSFRIYIPRIPEESHQNTENAASAIPPASGQTILLAEDDPQVRMLAIRILEQGGYRVIPAANGEEAVAAFHRNAGHIDACVIDVVMPKLSGRQVREQIHTLRPGLPVLHISGYDFNILDREIAPEKGVPLLTKPFTSAELLTKVRELVT
ncbi:MAG: PAS domain S-box protein, partial [Candidatus Hydrogenedentes bacterium]|nr:PAS domain S-box protein [Candidatus Hydrogenedentota bacterium]